VPDLPLAAELRAEPELAGRPLALTSGPGARAEIVAVSSEAARRGVRRFTSVAHARSLCSELCTRVASPARESAARGALLDAALSLSPRAALASPVSGSRAAEAAVFVDASGVDALFHSEAGFAAALEARARQLGLPACVAVASSQGLARIAARELAAGEVRVLAPGSEAEALSRLPVELLDPDDEVAEALTRFGVRCVGDLLALPRRALGTRLGPSVLELVARARGEAQEPPLCVPPQRSLVEAIDLEFAIARLEPLVFVLQGLLSRLLARLQTRRLACDALSLRLAFEGGAADERRIGLAAPTLDLRVLVRLLGQSLEERPPRAPVVSAALETVGRELPGDQLDFFRPAGPAPGNLGRTLAALQALCGPGRVGTPRPADDHRPHRFEMVPAAASPTSSPCLDAPERPSVWGLAVRALRPPVPAQVRLRGHGPGWIRSAVANGRILHLAGPWRTTGGWWSPQDRFAYNHYDVETSDGTLARLRFDHVQGRWHVDAVYD
jgi:protein ImuB